MARRSKILSHDDRLKLLAAMKECRRAANNASGSIVIGGPQYRALEALNQAIDDAAEALTGDRGAVRWRLDTSEIR